MIRSELVQLLANENSDLALRDIEVIGITFFDFQRIVRGGPVEMRRSGADADGTRD